MKYNSLKIFVIIFNIMVCFFNIYIIYLNNKRKKICDNDNNIYSETYLELSDTNVKEIMTARTSIYALEKSEIIENVIDNIIENGFSRIPVYDGSIDNIIGILYIKDILKIDTKKMVGDFVKDAFYIPETMSILKLLEEFRLNQKHIAIIIDEYGGTLGLVSIEDILEEIVGEIRDEYDKEVDDVIQIADNIYEIQGETLVEEVDDKLGIKIPVSDEYDTISGYVQYASGKLPEKNDMVSTENYVIKILELENKRIKKIKLVLLKTGGSDNE